MKIKQINNIKIKAIKEDKCVQLPVKNKEMIDNAYANIFLLAKKRSGKSTLLYRLVKSCIDRETKIYIFCSTAYRDYTYQKLMDCFDKKSVHYEVYTSLMEDGQNKLAELIDELKHDDKDTDDEDDDEIQHKEQKIYKLNDDDDDETTKKRKYKPKYLCPKNIIIFDDMGSSLKNDRNVEQLLKTNRHSKSRVIISSQYLNDISIASRLQLDYIIMFAGLPDNKILETYKNLDLAINFEEFYDMYNHATNEKYNFLFVDIRNEKYRHNFSHELIPN